MAAGLPDGEYSPAALRIKEDGVVKLLDRSAICRKRRNEDMLVRTFRGLTGAPLCGRRPYGVADAGRAEFGIDRKPALPRQEKVADLLVFDEDIQIRAISVGGRIELSELAGVDTETNVSPVLGCTLRQGSAVFLKRNDSACPRGPRILRITALSACVPARRQQGAAAYHAGDGKECSCTAA